MSLRVLVAVIAYAWAAGAQAATIGEERGMQITALNATDFEVIEGNSYGAAEFWCGAATFVEQRSNRSNLTPIYVKRPRGPSVTLAGRKSVVFTTQADGLPEAAPRSSLTVREAGATLKSAQARRYCRDAFTRSTK